MTCSRLLHVLMAEITAFRFSFAILLGVLSYGAVAQQDDQGSAQEAENAVPVQSEEPAENDSTINREPIPEFVDPSLLRRSIIMVDDAQRIASERFGNFIGEMDGFFSRAGTNDDAISNESWARIRLDATIDSEDGFDLDPSVKIRLVLPETERKLKLLVSTEDEDGQDSVNVQTAASPTQGNGASLALRFARSARENTDVDLDIGLRQKDGSLQFFARVNTRVKLTFGDDWFFTAGNSYRYFVRSGFQNTLEFNFRRLINQKENLYFANSTDFFWEKGQRGAEISHVSGFYWQLGDRRSLALEGLARYDTALNGDATDRFQGSRIRIRWRQNIWRSWFFYEVWPSVAWPSSNDFRQVNGIFLRAEVIIGQNK